MFRGKKWQRARLAGLRYNSRHDSERWRRDPPRLAGSGGGQPPGSGSRARADRAQIWRRTGRRSAGRTQPRRVALRRRDLSGNDAAQARQQRRASDHPVPDQGFRGPVPSRSRTFESALPGQPAYLGGDRLAGVVWSTPRRTDALDHPARPGCVQRGVAALRQRFRPVPVVPRRQHLDRVHLHRR